MKLKTATRKPTLDLVVKQWKGCTKCEIGRHVRKHVFLDTIPEGLNKADILLIGEGPGQVEDVKGLPFVGPAGKLMREAIEDANPGCRNCDGSGYDDGTDSGCGFCKGQGYVRIGLSNLLVCRPYETKATSSGNRPPSQEEVENCLPRLVDTIVALNPTLIFTMGKEPESYISLIREELSLKGMQVEFVSMKHPSALLRQIGSDKSSLLYKQYVDQFDAYFGHWFDANQVEHLQEIGRLYKRKKG